MSDDEGDRFETYAADTSSIRREVAVRLARLVEQVYPNQDIAARIAGTSKSTLQRHIAGSTRLDFEIIARLTRCAGRSLDWLAWGGEAAPRAEAEDEAAASDSADRLRVRDCAYYVLTTTRHFGNEYSPEELADAIAARYANIKNEDAS